jgi:Protein of unknown function (DUF3303)
MKYVIEWHPRAGASSAENLATTKRSLEVLAKWTPGGTMHQLLFRVDGGGGFTVVESDDAAVIARDCAIFAPFLEVTAYPVMDVEPAVGVLQQALDFTEHA